MVEAAFLRYGFICSAYFSWRNSSSYFACGFGEQNVDLALDRCSSRVFSCDLIGWETDLSRESSWDDVMGRMASQEFGLRKWTTSKNEQIGVCFVCILIREKRTFQRLVALSQFIHRIWNRGHKFWLVSIDSSGLLVPSGTFSLIPDVSSLLLNNLRVEFFLVNYEWWK